VRARRFKGGPSEDWRAAATPTLMERGTSRYGHQLMRGPEVRAPHDKTAPLEWPATNHEEHHRFGEENPGEEVLYRRRADPVDRPAGGPRCPRRPSKAPNLEGVSTTCVRPAAAAGAGAPARHAATRRGCAWCWAAIKAAAKHGACFKARDTGDALLSSRCRAIPTDEAFSPRSF